VPRYLRIVLITGPSGFHFGEPSAAPVGELQECRLEGRRTNKLPSNARSGGFKPRLKETFRPFEIQDIRRETESNLSDKPSLR
jgi:hypothetical protein